MPMFDAPKLQPPIDHAGYASLGWAAITLVFGAFGGLSAAAPLDSAAIASGRVAAESSTKPLQHLEGGIVREVLVKEAQKVREGQVLFRLEPTQARANQDMVRKQFDAALAEEARLVAEREGATSVVFPTELLAHRTVSETASSIADQERQFTERRKTLLNETRIHRARLAQNEKERASADDQIGSLTDQIRNMDSDIENLSGLAAKGLYPKSKLNALKREHSRLKGQLAGFEGEIARLNEVKAQIELEISQVEQKFREDAGRQLAEVRQRLSDSREKLSVANDVMNRVEIAAPQDGIVQAIKVLSTGAVVKPGETIAELVPTGDKLVMSVRVSPLDIDSVEPGQKAEVRFPGFSTRGFRTILGSVERVGADVVLDEMTKDPYYLARVVVDPESVPDEVERRLQPGMPADVLITTGERTMLQYMLGPISDVVAKSMREK
jgi:HlyD family secretion protein